jgi:hypothetical protein
VTSGDAINDVAALLEGRDEYSAHDVIDWLDPVEHATTLDDHRAPEPATARP